MSADSSVNDPVHVSREGRQLEGVIAYLGSVSFSAGDDWVGIRLTGSSVGLGKNDGSVQGNQYFDCPPQCGLFVKKSAVTGRELTRLEELRLRRELAQANATENKAKTPSKTPATSSSSTSTPAAKTPSSANRLEEIRRRREALSGGGGGSATKPPTVSSTSSLASLDVTASSSGGAGEDAASKALWQSQIDQLTSQLKYKDGQIETLQTDLAQAKEEASSNLSKAKEMQEQLENSTTIPKEAAAPAPTIQKIGSSSTLEDSQLEMQQLERELESVQGELKALQTSSQQELEKERAALKKHQVDLTAAKTELEELQNQLAHLAEQSEVRGASDASHYKERARLQGEVASLNRKVEQLELDKQELENNVEELTFEKEQLQEDKEGLEDRLEELKLDTETAQMEVEELRMELEEANTTQEPSETITSPSKGGELNEAQDMAQNLSVQNARLREALIRLREQAAVEKMELSRQLRSVEKDAEEAKTLASEVESLRNLKVSWGEQISDLKDMVEQGSAYEVMVEDLSDRVLSLEEELVACQQTIREMEEAADITAEMEEVQTEELKALNRDLEDRESIIRNLEEAIKM
jgi:dynactin 1